MIGERTVRKMINKGQIPGTCLKEAYRRKSIGTVKRVDMDNRMPPISQAEVDSFTMLMEGAGGDMDHLEEHYNMKVFQRIYNDTGNAVLAMECANKKLIDVEYGHPTDEDDDDIDIHLADFEEEEQEPEPTHFSRKTKKPPYQRLTALRMKIEKITSDRDV
jgi:hypothetical protein